MNIDKKFFDFFKIRQKLDLLTLWRIEIKLEDKNRLYLSNPPTLKIDFYFMKFKI